LHPLIRRFVELDM